MRRILVTLVLMLGLSLSLFASGAVSAGKSAITTFKLSVDRDKFEHELKDKLTKEGYTYVGIHENIQSAYKKKFGTTKMAILDFISYYNPKLFATISDESPTVAGTFYPFTFVVHRSEHDKNMYVSYLNGEFIKTLGNLTQKRVRDAIDAEYAKLDKLVAHLAGAHEAKPWVGTPAKIEDGIFEYKVKIPAPEKAERLLLLVEEQLDNFIGAGGFVNAGFRGINGDLKKINYDKFDFYDEYLLCSFPISNAIFNDYPQAGAFAPCPVFIYQEKGSEYLTIGVMKMEIWSQFAPITDCKTKEIVKKAAQEVQFVLKYSAELALKKLNYEIMMEGDDDDL